jgi:hypothetical protein
MWLHVLQYLGLQTPKYDTYSKPTEEYTPANAAGLLEQEQRWHMGTYRHLRAKMHKANQ